MNPKYLAEWINEITPCSMGIIGESLYGFRVSPGDSPIEILMGVIESPPDQITGPKGSLNVRGYPEWDPTNRHFQEIAQAVYWNCSKRLGSELKVPSNLNEWLGVLASVSKAHGGQQYDDLINKLMTMTREAFGRPAPSPEEVRAAQQPKQSPLGQFFSSPTQLGHTAAQPAAQPSQPQQGKTTVTLRNVTTVPKVIQADRVVKVTTPTGMEYYAIAWGPSGTFTNSRKLRKGTGSQLVKLAPSLFNAVPRNLKHIFRAPRLAYGNLITVTPKNIVSISGPVHTS